MKQTAPASQPVEMNAEMPILMRIFMNFPLILMLLRNDFRAKFRHSILGFLWLFIPPLFILLIYVYMFQYVFQMRWAEPAVTSRWAAGLSIYAGITIYTAFSDTVMGSLTLLVSRPAMLKRVPFPLELFPVSLTASNMIVSGIILWILFLLSLATGGSGSCLAPFYFPVIYLPFALFLTGICWITAALGVFFRDLGNLLSILLLMFFFASPILYSEKMVPESMACFIRWNPLTPVIQNIRAIFLQNKLPDGFGLLWSWGIGLTVFHGGFYCFQRMRRYFADVV